MPKLRKLVHTLRTPLTILEMNLQRLQENWHRLAANVANVAEREHIEIAINAISRESQRILECINIATDVHAMDEQPDATIADNTAKYAISKKRLLYYFPTAIACVDDDPAFSSAMQHLLGKDTVACIYNNPVQAVQQLKKQALLRNLQKTLIKNIDIDETDAEQPIAELDIALIKQLILDQNRHKYISTVVVDYHMPQMDGLQFCEALKDTPVKKILLTGDADYARAVNAFNRKLIDGFVLKGGTEMQPRLTAAITKLATDQFPMLADQYSLAAFVDPALDDLHATWVQQNAIVEYYLLNSSGSYLGISATGAVSVLLMQSEVDNNSIYESACQHKLASELCAKLNSKQFILGLLTAAEAKLPAHTWPEYLYPAQIIAGESGTYFYSILDSEILERFV